MLTTVKTSLAVVPGDRTKPGQRVHKPNPEILMRHTLSAFPDLTKTEESFRKEGEKMQKRREKVSLEIILLLCNKIWVMSCPWGFDCRTLFVGYQNHRNGLFFRCENSFGVGRIFFLLKSELFRCEKVQKGLIQPGRHLRNVFGSQFF